MNSDETVPGNLQLDSIFVREFEQLRTRLNSATFHEGGSSAREVAELKATIETLRARVSELEEANHREAARYREGNKSWIAESRRMLDEHQAEVKQLIAAHAVEINTLEQRHAASLREQSKDSRQVYDEANARAEEAMKATLAKKTAALETQAKARYMERVKAWNALRDQEIETLRETLVAGLEEQFARQTFVPLRMRLMVLILDVFFFVAAIVAIRLGTAWTESIPIERLVVYALGLFALGSFLLPGKFLLGIRERQMGPDRRSIGPARVDSRFFCGLMHFAPLLAIAVVALINEPTRQSVANLVAWAESPEPSRFRAAIEPIVGPMAPILVSVILMASAVWWGLLLLSILAFALVQRHTPQYRNVTLVEFLWSVGFERVSPPQLETPEMAIIE